MFYPIKCTLHHPSQPFKPATQRPTPKGLGARKCRILAGPDISTLREDFIGSKVESAKKLTSIIKAHQKIVDDARCSMRKIDAEITQLHTSPLDEKVVRKYALMNSKLNLLSKSTTLHSPQHEELLDHIKKLEANVPSYPSTEWHLNAFLIKKANDIMLEKSEYNQPGVLATLYTDSEVRGGMM